MRLIHRPLESWPGKFTDPRRGSPFASTWSSTLDLLGRELAHLRVDEAVLQVAVAERECRLDGQIRADARPAHPGVILSFETRRHGKLSYPCDTFDGWAGKPGWQQNVRAIALGLEALRKVERYGIADRGQQYTGWKALGSGLPMPAATMTVEDAARFLIEHGEWGGTPASVEVIVGAERDVVTAYFREAAKKLHPDVGGDPDLFRRLNEARDLLLLGGVA